MIQASLKKKLFAAKGEMYLDVDMEIGAGELVALYGGSGAGKTTILRMLCGLTLPDNGHIAVQEQTWFDTAKKINLRPQQRDVGIVFQDYALFPNMTVKENLAFALDKKQSPAIVEELLDLMELAKLYNLKPSLLSGGQRQRVALARAIVRKPKLLLLDEPMSALDTTLRLKIQDYIMRVHERFHLTTILVSHDILEVVRLAKKVFVIDHGKLIQQGVPGEILPLQALKQMIDKLPDQKVV